LRQAPSAVGDGLCVGAPRFAGFVMPLITALAPESAVAVPAALLAVTRTRIVELASAATSW
jgi:hypothetical protein